jgi:hypothetical protein
MTRKRRSSERNRWKCSLWERTQRKIMEKRLFGLKAGGKTLKIKDRGTHETFRRNWNNLPKAENGHRSSWNRPFNLKIFIQRKHLWRSFNKYSSVRVKNRGITQTIGRPKASDW